MRLQREQAKQALGRFGEIGIAIFYRDVAETDYSMCTLQFSFLSLYMTATRGPRKDGFSDGGGHLSMTV